MAPWVGFEPTTSRLTAGCSTAELPRITSGAARSVTDVRYGRGLLEKSYRVHKGGCALSAGAPALPMPVYPACRQRP